MPFLDVRTVIFSHAMTDALCVAVLVFLWLQNRKRFRGAFFWLLDLVCQTLAVVLIVLRGAIPDWVSMTFINTLTVAGAFLGYVGLTLFVGSKRSQVHNYVLLAILFFVHLYYLFVQPSLIIRNINISIGLFVMCFQCVWLVFHRVEPGMRRSLRGVGLVFVAFCTVSVIRILVILINPYPDDDFFNAGTYDTLVLLSYQILLILLTFAFTLSVNQRLVKDVRTQEEKFSKAFRSSPYGITLTRPSDGRILDVNDGFTAISGYSCAEVIGKNTLDLHLWVRDEERTAVVSELRQGKRVIGREYQFRRKSGETLTSLFSAEIIEIDDQPWILSSMADITERKQAEEALLKGNTVLKNMLLASSGFIDSSSSGINYQMMTDALLEIAGAKYAAFNAFDENGLDFTTMAVSGLPGSVASATSILGFQLTNKKWKHDPMRAEKTRNQAVTVFPSLHDLTGAVIPPALSIFIERTFDIGEVAIVKIVRNSRVVGDFTIFFSRGYTLQNRELVELFANESGLFMERTQAEDALRASEQKYRLLFTTTVSGFAVLEMIYDDEGNPIDYRHIEVNPAHEVLTGLKTDLVVGRTIKEILPDIEDVWIVTYGRVDKSGIAEHIEQYSTALSRWFSVYAYQTAPGFVAVTFENITERKRAEEALRETSGYLNNLLDYANAPIIVWDAAFRITLFNHAFEHLTGRSAASVLGQNVDLLFPPEKRTEYLANMRKASSGERWEVVEIGVQHVNGDVRTLLWNSASLYGSDDVTVVATIAQGQDISERKRAEEALRISLSRQEALLAAVPDIIMEVNTLKIDVWTNQAGYEFYGPDVIGKEASFYFEGEQRTYDAVAPLFNGDEQVVYVESWQRRQDGENRLLAWWCRVLKDAQGVVTGALSTGRDITERKQAEESLRDSEARYRELVGRLSEGVAVANPEDVFTLANSAAERIFGVGPGQLVGTRFGAFLAPENQEVVRQKTEQRAQGRSDTYELEIIRAGGEHHLIQVTASPLYDANNRFSGSTGVFRDITESKRAEDEIHSLARFVSENPDAVLRVSKNGILLYVNPQGLIQLPEWHLRVGDIVPSSVQRVVNESMGGTSRLAIDLDHGSQIFSFLLVPVVEAGYANLYGHDVTHRRESERALAESEERFQLANQATFNVIWDWNLATGTLWYNDNYAKLSGYSLDELQNDAEWWTSQVHPQDLEGVMISIQAATSSGQDRWLDEYRIRRKDGSYANVEVRGHIARDANGFPVRVIGAMQDISQRKRSAAYLEMSGQVLQILNEPADMQDSIGRVLEQIKTRTGFAAVGIRLQEGEDYPYLAENGFGPDFLLKENSLLERTVDGEVIRNQFGQANLECTCGMVINGKTEASSPFFTPGGSFWTNDALPLLEMPPEQDPRHHPRNHCIFAGFTSIALIPIRDQEKTVGLLHLCDQRKGCFAEDTVELLEGIASHIGAALMRKQAEGALRASKEREVQTILDEQQRRLEIEKRAAVALEAKALELARSNRELEQFAYVASHDLQEPLRMVVSYTQFLSEKYKGQLDAKADKYIGYAVEGAVRMQTLISDLLSYSRVSTQAKPLVVTSSAALVREAIHDLGKAIEESGAEVIVEDLPTVMADGTQLRQVFQNLIANAIKFRGDAPPRVEVTVHQDGANWEFCVADNGIGIDPQFHDRVFIIFQRLHERGKYPGSGIGLSIVKKIIERHGGRIWIESQVGEGTRFKFTLPVATLEGQDS